MRHGRRMRPGGAWPAALFGTLPLLAGACSPYSLATPGRLRSAATDDLCAYRDVPVDGVRIQRELRRRGADCAAMELAALTGRGPGSDFARAPPPPLPPPLPGRSAMLPPPVPLAPPVPPVRAAPEARDWFATGPDADAPLPPQGWAAPWRGAPWRGEGGQAFAATRPEPRDRMEPTPSPDEREWIERTEPPRGIAPDTPAEPPAAAPPRASAAVTGPPAGPPAGAPAEGAARGSASSSARAAAALAPLIAPGCAERLVEAAIASGPRGTVAFRNRCDVPIRVRFSVRPGTALTEVTPLLRPGETSPPAALAEGFEHPGFVVCSYAQAPERALCQ